MNVLPSFKFFVIAVVGMLAAGLFIQFLVDINSRIPLPEWLKPWVENQAANEKLLEVFFSGKSMLHLLLLVFVIGILPALSEEMMFRGVLQPELAKTSLGNYGSIIMVGLVFSLVHFEFDFFLARWLMGIFLGLLFFTSQSLWVSITGHFFNNFVI
ncbi:MAG: CPBP family intramembrane glutamic endopeptidase, partial [Sphingobacteriales bacterium]